MFWLILDLNKWMMYGVIFRILLNEQRECSVKEIEKKNRMNKWLI